MSSSVAQAKRLPGVSPSAQTLCVINTRFSTEMSKFGSASESEWVLDRTIDGGRRSRLLQSPPFECIVTELLDNAQITKIGRQRAPDGQLGQRCSVVLEANPEMLDTFFNSASGYRAQYLLDPEQGNRANRFVLDKALPTILRTLDGRRTNPVFVESSLTHSWAKVWIHQGLWMHRAKCEHRVLCVPRWQRELASQDKKRRKLARWGALAPENESRMLLKGGYVLSTEKLCIGKPQSKRAREIHDLGFT